MNRNSPMKNVVLTISLLLNVALVILVFYLVNDNDPSLPLSSNSDLRSEVYGEMIQEELSEDLPEGDFAQELAEDEQPEDVIVNIDVPETQPQPAETTAASTVRLTTTARPAATTTKKTAAPTTAADRKSVV